MAFRFSALFCLAVLFTGVAFAKFCQVVPAGFPSVDAGGNASLDNPGDGQGKICLNTKNNKFVAKASGQTPNESNAKQTFKDDATVNEFYGGGGLLISRSKLKVAADGACKLLLKGIADV